MIMSTVNIDIIKTKCCVYFNYKTEKKTIHQRFFDATILVTISPIGF